MGRETLENANRVSRRQPISPCELSRKLNLPAQQARDSRGKGLAQPPHAYVAQAHTQGFTRRRGLPNTSNHLNEHTNCRTYESPITTARRSLTVNDLIHWNRVLQSGLKNSHLNTHGCLFDYSGREPGPRDNTSHDMTSMGLLEVECSMICEYRDSSKSLQAIPITTSHTNTHLNLPFCTAEPVSLPQYNDIPLSALPSGPAVN